MKFTDNLRPKHSPWGHIVGCENVATGIWRIDTALNGGYYISEERKRAMPPPLRCYATLVEQTGIGTGQWYEENRDWSIVCLAFSNDFTRKLGLAERPRVLQIARTIAESIQDPGVQRWLKDN